MNALLAYSLIAPAIILAAAALTLYARLTSRY